MGKYDRALRYPTRVTFQTASAFEEVVSLLPALSCIVMAASTIAPTSSPAAIVPPMNAQELFARAFQRLESYPIAPYIVWTDLRKTRQTSMMPGGPIGTGVSVIRYAVRSSDGAESYSGLPIDPKVLPPVQVGVQFLGPFAFALRPGQRAQAMAPLQPDVPIVLPVIADVVARAKPNYQVTIAGAEAIAGHATYHLHLTPLSDPRRHNLRDLWVDTTTFDLWKAHFTSTYAPGELLPQSPTDVTVSFVPIASYWVVAEARWNWEDYNDGFSFEYDASTLLITFPAMLPDWLFDERAYRRHEAAREPDYLSGFIGPPTVAPASSPP